MSLSTYHLGRFDLGLCRAGLLQGPFGKHQAFLPVSVPRGLPASFPESSRFDPATILQGPFWADPLLPTPPRLFIPNHPMFMLFRGSAPERDKNGTLRDKNGVVSAKGDLPKKCLAGWLRGQKRDDSGNGAGRPRGTETGEKRDLSAKALAAGQTATTLVGIG